MFHFEYTFKSLNYTFIVDVDMGDYWKYIKIFRWGMTIFLLLVYFCNCEIYHICLSYGWLIERSDFMSAAGVRAFLFQSQLLRFLF